MHQLSFLLERYIYENDRFDCRQNLLYLEGLINELPETGISCPDSAYSVKDAFEKLLKKLGIPEKYGLCEISDELLFKVAAEEYINGFFGSASEFLFYKPYVAENIGFPHKIDYSERTDEYTASGMTAAETEKTALKYLNNKGITLKTNDKNK